MSPTVRDGRRQRTEYAVELAAIGTGPIERRLAGADERAGFAPGRPSPGLPAVVPRRMPIADLIQDNASPIAALIHLADPPGPPVAPVTPVTPEELAMAIEPPPPPESRLDALRAVVAAVDELVAATEAYHAAGARVAAAERAVDEAWVRAPWRPKAWTNIPEIIPEQPVRTRVSVDDPALEEERQTALEDIAVAAALRDDRLGDEPADDAPEVLTRRPKATTEPAGEPGKTAAETRRAAAAAGGGPGPTLSRQQARVLESALRHGGDFKAIADDVGCTRQNARLALDVVGRKGLLPIELIAKLPAGFAKYSPAGI